jgi:antirestriction protein ArdC
MAQSRIQNAELWTAERIIQLIGEGNLPPWAKAWSTTPEQAPHNLLNTKTPYRGLNYLLLSMVMDIFESPFFITPKQLFALGGSIKKGEEKKWWPVHFWNFPSPSLRRGAAIDDDSSKSAEKVKGQFFCKAYRVYNIKQTEGIPVEKIPVIPEPETFEHTPIEACEAIVAGYVTCPEVIVIDQRQEQRASYAPGEDKIYIPDRTRFQTSEDHYSTLFHEMTHSTGHPSRLNRACIKYIIDNLGRTVSLGNPLYSEEELVAEFGAAMLCGRAGIAMKTIENSASYIKSWSAKLNPEMLVLGSRAARKAFELIIGEAAKEAAA